MIPKLLYLAPLAFAYWAGIAGTARRASAGARILMYHGVPPRSAGALERQLRYLRRNFDVVSIDTLLAARRSGAGGLARKVVLTFDDGLRNNVTVVYPILKRLGLPATFYVCPRLADTGRWLWNHEARQRLLRLDGPQLERLAHEAGAPAGGAEDFVTWMKGLDLGERRRIEGCVRAATEGFHPDAGEREEFDIAGWEDLRELDPRIVTVGSHTLTHAILPALPPAELENEVGRSRRELEDALQREVKHFAYPNGDFNEEARDCVRRHYRSAVATCEGAIGTSTDPYALPREAAPQGTLRLALSVHRQPASSSSCLSARPAARSPAPETRRAARYTAPS